MKSICGDHRPECHLQKELPHISDKNVKEGIFAGHCVKELANEGNFYEVLKETVNRTLGAFRLVLTTFWAATKRPPPKKNRPLSEPTHKVYNMTVPNCIAENALLSFSRGILFSASLEDLNVETGLGYKRRISLLEMES